MLELVTIALLIGIAAFTTSCILMAPGEILAFWAAVVSRLPRWIAKPLGACEKCMAGQAALWLYPFWFTDGSWDAVLHILFITTAVFSAAMTKAIYIRMTGTDTVIHKPWVKIPDELKALKNQQHE